MSNLPQEPIISAKDLDESRMKELNEEKLGSVLSSSTEMVAWLAGVSEGLPSNINEMFKGIADKMSVAMAFVTVQMFERLGNLMKFQSKAENVLYGESVDVAGMSNDSLRERYQEATRVSSQTMEFIRKFIVQNKDAIVPPSEKDAALARLSSLSPEALEKLISMLTESKKE